MLERLFAGEEQTALPQTVVEIQAMDTEKSIAQRGGTQSLGISGAAPTRQLFSSPAEGENALRS